MKFTWIKVMALSACAVVYSHAIFGIGAQWAPSPGLKIKSDSGEVASDGFIRRYSVQETGVSGLSGMGLKLWIDFLPIIDLEAGTNFQYGYYDINVIGPDGTTSVKPNMHFPFVDNRPAFVRIVSDASVLYPF